MDKRTGNSAAAAAELDRVVMDAAALSEGAVPNEILIAPWGEVRTSAGDFVLDAEAAVETIAAFEAHGTDVPVDFEHQTLGGAYSAPDGLAPAAGWIKALSAVSPEEAAATGRAAGLWGRVEWTEDGARRLAARQYRYLSPVALVRRSDRRLVGLHSVALTNKPAIARMRPVVARETVAVSAPESENGPDADVAEQLRAVLHLEEGTPRDVVLVAAADRILVLERLETMRRAEERVAAAMSEGKLTAGQREWALSLAVRDPEEFERWRRQAPALVPLGRLTLPATRRSAEPARSAEAAARAEWHQHRAFLEKLCSEEAFVAAARRESAG
ncbi:MAG: hypothetical protein DCC65_03440 [Planctomycetota bacterium]|nr:MAG: hypothetical protein DCC65_03440 [Planctomycetota bacterium]